MAVEIITIPDLRSPGDVMHAKAVVSKIIELHKSLKRPLPSKEAVAMVMGMCVALQWVCKVEHPNSKNTLQRILDGEPMA